MSELAFALGGGAVVLILALLLSFAAARLGVQAYGEQFAGLFLAGTLGTFIAREFAVKPR